MATTNVKNLIPFPFRGSGCKNLYSLRTIFFFRQLFVKFFTDLSSYWQSSRKTSHGGNSLLIASIKRLKARINGNIYEVVGEPGNTDTKNFYDKRDRFIALINNYRANHPL